MTAAVYVYAGKVVGRSSGGFAAFGSGGGGASFLAWNASTDATGYKVWWDTLSGPPYANSVDVGNVLSIASSSSLPGIGTGLRYLNVSPYDESGLDGAYGTEVTKTL